MACRTCLEGKKAFRLCKCCVLVDKDYTGKNVSYCTLCSAWLCEPCLNNPFKRILAFGKQFFS